MLSDATGHNDTHEEAHGSVIDIEPHIQLLTQLQPLVAVGIDPMLTIKEAAIHERCSVSTIWRRIKNDVIAKPIKIGGTVRIPLSHLHTARNSEHRNAA